MSLAEALRDEGIGRVANANAAWMQDCLDFIETLPQGWVGTGEDVRTLCGVDGLGDPTHPNAWGALMRTAVSSKRGWFELTGRLVKMRTPKSHARLTLEYRRK